VYETNFSNVESALLLKLNTQTTLRLVLRNAFRHDDPGLTESMQLLYKRCPRLFSRALTGTDQNEVQEQRPENRPDCLLSVPPSADGSHLDPKVMSKVCRSDLSKTHHVIQGLGPAPVSPKYMSHRFVMALRDAYVQDYGYPSHLPSAWNDNVPIEWAHKFAFNRPAMSAGYVPQNQSHRRHLNPISLLAQSSFCYYRCQK